MLCYAVGLEILEAGQVITTMDFELISAAFVQLAAARAASARIQYLLLILHFPSLYRAPVPAVWGYCRGNKPWINTGGPPRATSLEQLES